MNTGGPAYPQHGWSNDPKVLERMKNQGGMTLLDWMAGQALAGLCASPETQMPFDVMHRLAYDHAEAMLDEKARREEDHPEDKLGKDHSPDANKTVPSQSALIRSGWDLFTWADKAMSETDEGRVFLHNWKEALELGGSDHSPDAGKVTEINRELVEALETCEYALSKFAPQEESAYGMAWIKVRAALAKAKGSQ